MDSISSLLTDEIVRSAPTKKKPYTIRDGRGLFVLIHPNGSRYFQLRATIEGKRKLMQLGVYPQVSISAKNYQVQQFGLKIANPSASGND